MNYSHCEKCVHAKISTTGGVIMKNGTMIIQSSGGTSITCQEKVIRSITMTDNGMICSSYLERKEAGGLHSE